jgi:hypothetical protein
MSKLIDSGSDMTMFGQLTNVEVYACSPAEKDHHDK